MYPGNNENELFQESLLGPKENLSQMQKAEIYADMLLILN